MKSQKDGKSRLFGFDADFILLSHGQYFPPASESTNASNSIRYAARSHLETLNKTAAYFHSVRHATVSTHPVPGNKSTACTRSTR